MVAALQEGHWVAQRSAQILAVARRDEGRQAGPRSSRTLETAPRDVAHKGRPTSSLALLLTASTSSRMIRTRMKSPRVGIPTTLATRGHRIRTKKKRNKSFEVRRISSGPTRRMIRRILIRGEGKTKRGVHRRGSRGESLPRGTTSANRVRRRRDTRSDTGRNTQVRYPFLRRFLILNRILELSFLS